MYIVKFLKRKDAASIVVAILLAMILVNPIQMIASFWSTYVVGSTGMYGYAPGWKEAYAAPIVTLVISLIIVEVGLRAFVWLRARLVRRHR